MLCSHQWPLRANHPPGGGDPWRVPRASERPASLQNSRLGSCLFCAQGRLELSATLRLPVPCPRRCAFLHLFPWVIPTAALGRRLMGGAMSPVEWDSKWRSSANHSELGRLTKGFSDYPLGKL